MKKHIFTLLLTLCLAVCFLPGTALAADSDFIIENGVLIEYIGPGGKAIIPDGVTSIGAEAFRSCESLTSVTIPDSVTRIGDHAFYCCFKLTSVTIPDSVTSIGDDAFGHCDSLTSVTVPDSVTKIGSMAFSYCEGLTSAGPIGSNSNYEFGWTTAIPDYAFQHLPNLTSVTIPNSITSIGTSAFRDCKSLSSIIIPSSVTSIGVAAFSYCEGLTSVAIPDSVTSIGGSAFSGCKHLTSVTIPDSVTGIGDRVFEGCTRLTSAGPIGSNSSYEFGWTTAIPDYAFQYLPNLTSVTIPSSVTSIGASVFRGCESLTSVTIPSSVTDIENSAFSGCTGLTSVTIPSSVTDIGNSAFSGCTGLTSVTIPNSVTSIGATAFSYCESLTSVTIPSSVTSIGWDVFKNCTGLTSVTIPDGVTVIWPGAFSGCTGLTDVYYGGTEKQWKAIDFVIVNYGDGDDCLTSANIHYNSPMAPIMADPTNDALKVDGVSQVPTAYKIGGANYFLLRDVAMLLNGTKGQFSVDYDAQKQAVVIVTGQPYQPLGTELAGAAQSSTEAIVGNNDVYINGEKVDLAVYKIGGANYFKIRDLGENLGFNVGWTAEQGMFIESDKPYTDAD